MPMSAEERDLLDMQTELLQQAQESMNSGNALNELLMPILLQESGYEVEYGTKQVRNPRHAEIKRDLKRWEEFVSTHPTHSEGRRRIQELRSQLDDTPRTLDEQAIVGLTRTADPARDLREQNELALLERQGAALRGELPVNPGLLSDLDQQEEDLRASLLENLGTGFETSTPGIEALSEFGERKAAILDASRRDDIAGAGNLANQMGGFMDSLTNSRVNRGMAAGSMPGMQSSNLMNMANAYGAPLQFMQNSRMMDFQMNQANNAPGLLESMFAQGSGTAMTFGLGKLFGVM